MKLTALILFMLMIMRTPLFVVIATLALLGFHQNEVPLSIIAVEIYRIVDMPMLVALPLFSFAGFLLSEGQSAQRLVAMIQAFFGWLPAGLPIIVLVTCTVFTAFTGATGVTIVALGALLLPALEQVGYQRRFSLGLVTSSGSMGLLLLPSMPLIIYGIVAQQLAIGPTFELVDLFLAGIFPMLLMLLFLSIYCIWIHYKAPVPRHAFSWNKAKGALYAARWEIPMPFVLLGGIYAGLFTITEAAAVTAVYVLITQTVLYRDIAWKRIPAIIVKTSATIGAILIVLGVSLAFTNVLIDADVPNIIFSWTQIYITDKITFLIVLNLLLLALGAILDIFSALVIMVPLLLPVALSYDIHPVHLGIIFLANMQLGYFTPPVGINLFIASSRFKTPISDLYRATLPFFFVLLLVVLLITYFPVLSMWYLLL